MEAEIALDVDGVMADINFRFVKYVNMKYRTELEEKGLYPFKFSDITRWDWGDKARALGLSVKDCLAIVDWLWENDALSIPLTEPGLPRKVARLLEYRGVDTVTARKQEFQVKSWLSYHVIPYMAYVKESRKENLGYHIIIEDDPTLCELIDDSTIILLYDRPYNRSVRERDNVIRVYSFDDVLDKVEKIPRETSRYK